MKIARWFVLLALTVAACTAPEPAPPANGADVLLVVNAPLRAEAGRAQQIVNGAQLAVDEVNDAGGVAIGPTRHRLRLSTMDSGLSAATSADNVRDAIRRGAAAIIDEGTGVDASWQDANRAGVPIGIVHQGGDALVDPAARPNLYRIAPANHDLSSRLAGYLIPKNLRIAIVHDDSQYGLEGLASLQRAFAQNPDRVAVTIRMPSDSDGAAEVRRARGAGADALLLWARPAAIASVVRAARTDGWAAPVYTGPAGADPAVRRDLAGHPEWVDGIVFAAPRLTGEDGPESFALFRRAYEDRFGVEKAGVKQGGIDVIVPPAWAMYSYDFVRVVAKALSIAGTAGAGTKLVAALRRTSVAGANGDERGFGEGDHEGLAAGVFFARFHDFVWRPVKDDPPSAALPDVDQLAG